MQMWFRVVLHEGNEFVEKVTFISMLMVQRADNEDLYASVNHKDKWKFYRCAECGKKAERVD